MSESREYDEENKMQTGIKVYAENHYTSALLTELETGRERTMLVQPEEDQIYILGEEWEEREHRIPADYMEFFTLNPAEVEAAMARDLKESVPPISAWGIADKQEADSIAEIDDSFLAEEWTKIATSEDWNRMAERLNCYEGILLEAATKIISQAQQQGGEGLKM